jgi:L-alanine-DL-glutamate epimerase-like enolase superfamily enzyme
MAIGCRLLACLFHDLLAKANDGRDSFDIAGCWMAMQQSVCNLGRSGLAAGAISAVDAALCDAKSRILDLPLAILLRHCSDTMPIYGSGGFTTYSAGQSRSQLSNWVERDACRGGYSLVIRPPERLLVKVDVNKQLQ